jgi:23S rRNA (cytidine1920-2'-O)/16S rRNA (cytidine1409-2'-O)-methyltransferase
VTVRGVPVDRASSLVTFDDPIALAGDPAPFVSRGGEKLDSALRSLDVTVEGRRWLDAGASTGGFTDRLLQGGATDVAAVDVGYGQFDWRLRNDPRVTLLERTNVRELRVEDLPWRPDGVVADLSFISLTLVLPALATVAIDIADHILLVKPQFEVGRSLAPKGVVRDPVAWASALGRVADAAAEEDLGLVDVALAEPPGPAGNREFFIHLRRDVKADRSAIEREIDKARP